ncbi:IF-2-associated domain-containing protein, partial [Sphingobium fuliginis]|uniref:IF-2-associated domain-containing protein n=1 Tax=Sphingobium fuliginis (strain ATCC 27551) TaxID=336203 RepID=UPI0021002AE9
MSDSKEDKPVLGRKPLGIKRTVESGQVQQQFSHGRKNTVVVEVKRRRILGKPGEAGHAAPEPQADPTPVAAAPQAPAPQQPQARAPQPAPARPAPPQSLMSRQELQAKLLREAEEARMTALEEARRREDAQRLAASEEEKRRAEENRLAAEAAEAAEAEAARRTEVETGPAEET